MGPSKEENLVLHQGLIESTENEHRVVGDCYMDGVSTETSLWKK